MLYMAAAEFAEFFLAKYLPKHVVHAVSVIHTSVLHVVHRLAVTLGLRDVELLLLLLFHGCHAFQHADGLLDVVQHRQVADAYQQLGCCG